MSKKRNKSWNGKSNNRKNRVTEQERQISELLDQADAQDLLQISAIHSNVSMPLPNQEKLAWSVIDKADLVDAEELERRKAFRQKMRRRKIIHVSIGFGVVAVLLMVLALCGVFDRINPPAYEKYYVAAGASFMGEQPVVTLPENVSVGIPSLGQEPDVDNDKLDTTVYHALAEYCSENEYAVGEYEIQKNDYYIVDDQLCLVCTVFAQCQDYKKEDKGKTWRDLGYHGSSVEVTSGDTISSSDDGSVVWDSDHAIAENMIPIDVDTPINMYPVCLRLYVCLEG